jgi:hypothetical protein
MPASQIETQFGRGWILVLHSSLYKSTNFPLIRLGIGRFDPEMLSLANMQVAWTKFPADEGQATLCMLHHAALTTYKLNGELRTVSVPASMTDMHAIPQGLLLVVSTSSLGNQLNLRSA